MSDVAEYRPNPGHRGQEPEGEGGRCPFCWAEGKEVKWHFKGQPQQGYWFKCGTGLNNNSYYRTDTCKDRQISQLQERLEAWRDYYHNSDCIWEDDDVMKRLKDLGEI